MQQQRKSSFPFATRRSTHEAVTLTVDNYDVMTHDKAVFLKFYAPWCGHCRAMADDWAKLEEEWEGHPVGLVGEIDCTSDDGQPLCEDFDVQGFPTLVYGDPMSAEPYEGERDYESLSAFAKEHISKPICSVIRLEACDEEQSKIIQELLNKPNEELETIAQTVAEKVQAEEEAFDQVVAKIQEQYDAAVQNFNNQLETIKTEFHYKYVEQIMTMRIVEAGQDDDDDSDGVEDEL